MQMMAFIPGNRTAGFLILHGMCSVCCLCRHGSPTALTGVSPISIAVEQLSDL